MKKNTALYRKYRPQTFNDVIGQDHIVKVLEGALKQDNISHAYLFAGSRGTGKTSVARIVAHELKCEMEDVYEIDAASNRGIDDIREIRESVNTLPFRSLYKVYIVDEVHMLTKEAWNAFLKTLEEPPSHVIFIMATTEMEKVPETVLSRCQIFQFKKPNTAMLKEMVANVAKKEGFTLAPASTELIALLAEGSFRDAQGILQKVLSFSPAGASEKDKKIDPSEVEEVTGAPKNTLINECLSAISNKNLASAIKTLHAVSKENVDMRVFLKLLLQKMRAVLLLRVAPEMKPALESDITEEDKKLFAELSGEKGGGINAKTLSELLVAYDQIPHAYIPELPIELVLTKLFSVEGN
ncbi:MAG: DNA polymerase III, subunit gamma and tau [Candidatus Zambryskibacteria bacterium RIFCSPHIGHO2_01_FULL_43_25]|uniref:DNA polymerase III subunit gamma/tau n=1 Tax=Candidatus Zambryskibacteria bacterium RIFCSPLOWO2_01_FULL_45_21 TaxID=1802761 RepID=A0A1G2U159_9BACT|nr:MAG: DNA polymerase III, subunit gamma and tau [Candidatus Zambryskibacteria bacterium RIFCSPHIGHO2_01_FULL_43_25]OHB03255.1 MAG: DNA polymerase III, subunit gamma and tau [Candidatus Zambryskibacteria bacterium RIFCSPLOWO2_01_FULL_45_21]